MPHGNGNESSRGSPDIDRQVGSMFVELLETLLRERASEPMPRPEEAMTELVRCRERLAQHPGGGEGGWAAEAIADHLAYDAALIRYSRCMHIECDPRRFGVPRAERERIERLLESRGIPLGRS